MQGDTVELYQPYTSVAVIENEGQRWEPEQFTERVVSLFQESGIVPQAEFMMSKLRYTMSQR